jgi:hypothetical protein
VEVDALAAQAVEPTEQPANPGTTEELEKLGCFAPCRVSATKRSYK